MMIAKLTRCMIMSLTMCLSFSSAAFPQSKVVLNPPQVKEGLVMYWRTLFEASLGGKSETNTSVYKVKVMRISTSDSLDGLTAGQAMERTNQNMDRFASGAATSGVRRATIAFWVDISKSEPTITREEIPLDMGSAFPSFAFIGGSAKSRGTKLNNHGDFDPETSVSFKTIVSTDGSDVLPRYASYYSVSNPSVGTVYWLKRDDNRPVYSSDEEDCIAEAIPCYGITGGLPRRLGDSWGGSFMYKYGTSQSSNITFDSVEVHNGHNEAILKYKCTNPLKGKNEPAELSGIVWVRLSDGIIDRVETNTTYILSKITMHIVTTRFDADPTKLK